MSDESNNFDGKFVALRESDRRDFLKQQQQRTMMSSKRLDVQKKLKLKSLQFAKAVRSNESESQQLNDSTLRGKQMTSSEGQQEAVLQKTKAKKKKQKRQRVAEMKEEKEKNATSTSTTSSSTSSFQSKKLKVNESNNDNYDDDDGLERQLSGSQFRFLNEQLYTVHSSEAQQMFQDAPELFDMYHKGFAEQTARWPESPVMTYAAKITALAKKHASTSQNALVVADFGCGDAQLAAKLNATKGVKCIVHSFDLVAVNDRVVACDIRRVPLPDRSVDVGVFCLSLMGTNWEDFLREAHRVLKDKATLLVAEVTSRIEEGGGRDKFASAVSSIGFDVVAKDSSNKFFERFEFRKRGAKPNPKPTKFKLGVCKYKRR